MPSKANKIFCAGCLSKLDISEIKPGSTITCPVCQNEILVNSSTKPKPQEKKKTSSLNKSNTKSKNKSLSAKKAPKLKKEIELKKPKIKHTHEPILKKQKAAESPTKETAQKAIFEKKSNSISHVVNPIRKRKKVQNNATLIIAFSLVFLVIIFIFVAGSSSDSQPPVITANSSTETEQKEEIAEKEKLKKQKEELKNKEIAEKEKLKKQKEERKNKEIAEKEKLEKRKEERKNKEIAEKEKTRQKELDNFLALTNPSQEQRKIFDNLPPASHTHLTQLINKHCIDCHNPKKRKGDLNLAVFNQPSSIFRAYQIIKHSYEYIAHREMPPKGENISEEDQYMLENYFRKIIFSLEGSKPKLSEGATIRRLTPYEYDYTLKDITGLDLKIGETFPGDGGGNQGFSNDANLMSVSPLLMEKMLEAAEAISNYSSFDINKGIVFSLKPPSIPSPSSFANDMQKEKFSLLKGIYKTRFNIEKELPSLMNAVAEYSLKTGNKNLESIASRKRVNLDFLKRAIKYFSSSAGKSEQEHKALKAWRSLRVGNVDEKDQSEAIKHFVNFYNESSRIFADRSNKDRKKHLGMVWNVENLFTLEPKTLSTMLPEAKLLKYQKATAYYNFSKFNSSSKEVYSFAQPLVYQFLYKVYRRPPSELELSIRVKDLLKDSVKFGLPLASRILVIREFSSLNFAFRIESKKSSRIDNYDLASRLSYFIWGGPPDDELYSLADEGKLKDEKVLREQVIRMLKDKKSARLAKHFANQWLQFGDILEIQGPDKKIFKDFNESLAKDMWQETAMCFNYIVKNDRSILEILDADYTIINNRLSRLYGLNQTSSDFRKVYVKDRKRGGILGHASFLAMTSFGKRTSPIIRGNWVLNVILGLKTPPPPMDVPALPEGEVVNEKFSLKEQLKQHRDNAACRSCHKKIDPLGIVLENYDTVGRWRNKYSDGKAKVDSVSEIDGEAFSGPEGLKKYLLDNKVKFLRNLSRKMVSYSLGRSTEFYDNHLINKMIENSIRNNYKFSSLVTTIVLSPQFQHK